MSIDGAALIERMHTQRAFQRATPHESSIFTYPTVCCLFMCTVHVGTQVGIISQASTNVRQTNNYIQVDDLHRKGPGGPQEKTAAFSSHCHVRYIAQGSDRPNKRNCTRKKKPCWGTSTT